jgi:hypothetical protein
MSRLLARLFPFLCFAILFLICYQSALLGGGQFAFRDAGHFYYPLHQRIQQEWNQGRWPLWEPEENGGAPLLGNPTAAVLYPGKIVFALLPYPWAARVYIVAHTALAFVMMFLLLRSWGTSFAGSGIAALSYAFAVPILFLYCNIIYLVGTSWLPLGFHAVDQWLRLRRSSALLELALVLTMQVLGGDLQTAFVLGLCALGYALGLARQRRSSRLDSLRPRSSWKIPLLALGLVVVWIPLVLIGARWAPTQRIAAMPPEPLPWMRWYNRALLVVWILAGLAILANRLRRGPRAALGTSLTGLAAAAALALMLAAAQLIPVLELSSRTFRAAEGGTNRVYLFSLEPTWLAGVIWPNFYGDAFARNSRCWFEYMPPLLRHASFWNPSLYLGGLTLILALTALGWRGGPPWRAWLTGVALLSLLASLGEYSSPLWWARWVPSIAREIGPHDVPEFNALRQDGYLRDGDGSFYWLLATVVPGFRQFRYPSKLFTFTTLALSALAGLGWDRVVSGRCRRAVALTATLLILSVVGLALAGSYGNAIMAYFASARTMEQTSIYGPLDAWGAYSMMCLALLQGIAVQVFALIVAFTGFRRPAIAGMLALAVITADLALANSRYVLTVPQRMLETDPKVVQIIKNAESRQPTDPLFRVFRLPYWLPVQWITQPSTERVEEHVAWARNSIEHKWGLPYGLSFTLNLGTTEFYDYLWFFEGEMRQASPAVAARLSLRPGDPVFDWPRRGFDLWNTRYFVVPAFPKDWSELDRSFASFMDESDRIYPPPRGFADSRQQDLFKQEVSGEDLQVYRNRTTYPRAWIVHQVRVHDPIASASPALRSQVIKDILFANTPLWNDPARQVFDPRQLAWVDSPTASHFANDLSGATATADETVRITTYEPQRVELDASLDSPGLVILADVVYPGWHLTIDGAEAPIYPVNLLMRGAVVPRGRHRLVYTYRPASFYLGRWVSVAGLVVFVALYLGRSKFPKFPVLVDKPPVPAGP